MALYVIQARGTDQTALERATIIEDGFSWLAFIFAQLWLIYHRLWLALLIWVLAEVAFTLLVLPHTATGTFIAVDFLAHLFIGFEGNRLRLVLGGDHDRRCETCIVAHPLGRHLQHAALAGKHQHLLGRRLARQRPQARARSAGKDHRNDAVRSRAGFCRHAHKSVPLEALAA